MNVIISNKTMKKYIFGSAILLAAMGTFTSCDLDEYNPTEVSGDKILDSPEGLYGMQALCYQPIYSQLYSVFDFMQMAELGTDIWWCDRNRTSIEQMFYYEGITSATNKGWDKAFTQMYSALGLCNTVIEHGKDKEDAQTKTLVAEAYYLRAMYHLLLTTYYGPITLVTSSPSETADLNPKRNTLSEIYSLIVSDLQYAVQNLPNEQTNRARATRKAAKGMLCRAYIQGAGQGLSDASGKSYWELARQESEDFITNMSQYNAYLYEDVSDVWADDNNRNNKEFLFVAAGLDATSDVDMYNASSSFNNKLFAYSYCNQKNLQELSLIEDDQYDPLYGRTNQSELAPSEYLLHCFNPSWDKRWENSFQTAYFGYSKHRLGTKTFNNSRVKWVEDAEGENEATMGNFGIDEEMVNKRIVPYVDLDSISYAGGGAQYPAMVWAKGRTAVGSTADPMQYLSKVKKIYVVDYPVAADDNRFYLYLYPEWADEYKNGYDKSGRVYCSVKIGSLFTTDDAGYRRYIMNQEELKVAEPSISKVTNVYTTRPSLNKYIWNYEGVYNGSNMQVRNGDVAVMRMAEIYLIAAEAEQHLGHGEKAAEYLNDLRRRAARATAKPADWELATATEEDIFDEYARELCGEFQRWSLLQRHQAFADRLTKYNGRAAQNYKSHMIWRPISATFLQQIDNKEEYGDNGYGTTAASGLDGFLQ